MDRQSALLDSYRFFYHRKDRRNERLEVVAATFILEGPLRSHLRIVADPDDRAVHVMLRNLEATPTRSYRFEPGQLDPAMLERMARLMLRQERTLVQVEVSESVRRQLQARLAEEATARAAEIEQARREDDEAGEDSGAGIKGRVRRVLATGRDGLGRGKRK